MALVFPSSPLLSKSIYSNLWKKGETNLLFSKNLPTLFFSSIQVRNCNEKQNFDCQIDYTDGKKIAILYNFFESSTTLPKGGNNYINIASTSSKFSFANIIEIYEDKRFACRSYFPFAVNAALVNLSSLPSIQRPPK